MAPNSDEERFVTGDYFDKYMADFDFQKQMMNTLTVSQFHKYMETDFQDQIFNTMRQLLKAEATNQNTEERTNSIPNVEADEAFPLSSLPFDISAQILLNLPFKSMVCCRRVCKSWRQLLSHPDFVQLHLVQSHANRLLIRSRSFFSSINYQQPLEEQGNSQIQFQNLNFFCRPEIFGSCNGLVCVAYREEEDDPVKLVLWNPSIGDYKLLPYAPPSDEPLYFDPFLDDTLLLVGLGYDPYSDDYTLVRVRFGTSRLIQGYIYSLKTDSWRVIELPTTNNLGWHLRPNLSAPVQKKYRPQGICINGVIYWLLYDMYNSNADVIVRWIVGFNLKDGKFFNLPLWEDRYLRTYYDTNILAIEESLGVYYVKNKYWTRPKVIEFWKRQHGGWTNLYNIPLSTVSAGVKEKVNTGEYSDDEWKAVGVFEDGSVVFYSLGFSYYDDYDDHPCNYHYTKRTGPVVYDTQAKTVITRHDNTLLDLVSYQEMAYSQTLVSPNMHAPSA